MKIRTFFRGSLIEIFSIDFSKCGYRWKAREFNFHEMIPKA